MKLLFNAIEMVCEELEDRGMMSAVVGHHYVAPVPATPAKPATVASPLSITQSGNQLIINGTTGNDQIALSQLGTTYTLKNGSWSTTTTGIFKSIQILGNGGNDSIVVDKSVTTSCVIKVTGTGNDTIVSGSGNDTIDASAGTNSITLGSGNDTVIALGSVADTINGGTGTDYYWLDNNTKTEVVNDAKATSAGRVHRIGSFINFMGLKNAQTAIPKTGGVLPEPTTNDGGITYKSFANNPLFADAGPAENDVAQGYTGDCFFLSVLSSVAKVDPGRIRNMVADLGDGTYAVQFTNPNGTQAFVRVDNKFATWGGGNLAYANFGAQNSMWVAVVEKAFAEYRYTTGNATTGYNYASYSAIDGGWMDESYTTLGCGSIELGGNSATAFATQVANALTAGKSVTFAVGNPPSGANLVGDHAYTVDHVTKDTKGNILSITVRNPWGVDGYTSTDGNNDGYVTLTVAQFYAAQIGAVAANV